MRLPYAPDQPAADAPDSVRETYKRIAARRHPRPLIPLDLTLLHSPAVAEGYNSFVGAIRTGTSLPADVLELAICRVAILTNAVWEWEAHSKLAVKAGVKRDVLEYVLTTDKKLRHSEVDSDSLDDLQRAVLQYTDEMTLNTAVKDTVWDHLRKAFERSGWREKELVELTVAIAGYNAVSRILVPLNVGERNGLAMTVPDVGQ